MPCTPAASSTSSWRHVYAAASSSTRSSAWTELHEQADAPAWQQYLKSVYRSGSSNESVAADLHALRWFWWWAPGAERLDIIEHVVWQRPPAVDAEAWVPGTSLERQVAAAGFFFQRRADAARQPFSSNQWIEVMRLSHRPTTELEFRAERSQIDQVWYFHAPGSGIWWHTGITLAVPNRSVLIRKLASTSTPTALNLSTCEVVPVVDGRKAQPFPMVRGKVSALTLLTPMERIRALANTQHAFATLRSR